MKKPSLFFIPLCFIATLFSYHDFTCYTSVMIDHVCYANEEDLEKLQIVKGSQRLISLDEKNYILSTFRKHPEYLVGGSGTNVVKALRHMDLSCSMIGTLGNDRYAQEIEEFLQEIGVVNRLTKLDLENGQVICLITPDGERTFAVYASSAYHTDCIDFDKELEETRFAYISGYHLREEAVIEKYIKASKNKARYIVLDLASENVIHGRKAWILDMLRNDIDIVFANEQEARTLTGKSPKEACEMLAKECEYAIVTHGSQGCYIAHNGEIVHVPAQPVSAIDTTGAGDVFSAGILYGIINNLSLKQSGEIATRLAAEVIQVVGNEIPKERWEQLAPTLFTRE